MLAKRLEYGDTIGIVGPSNWMKKERVDLFVEIEQFLLDKGFHIKRGKHLYDEWYESAGTPQDRAKDLMEMFLDDEVDVVLCMEGGATSNTILPYLDFDVIKQHPKILIGFSDISVLLETVYDRTGLITFHGPTIFTFTNRETREEQFDKVVNRLMEGNPIIDLGQDMSIIRDGLLEGISLGTNLGCTMNLLATPYFPDFTDKIFIVEGLHVRPNEACQRIAQLKQQGFFDRIKGVVVGNVYDLDKEESAPKFEQMLKDCTSEYTFPIVKCNTFGHHMITDVIPIGACMKFEQSKNILVITEPFLL